MEYAIETIGLTKIFSDWWGRARVYAVDDLNLQILPNEVFGLLGPNGSGKTTTIKMLLGLLHPTKGHALILGGDGTQSEDQQTRRLPARGVLSVPVPQRPGDAGLLWPAVRPGFQDA